MIKDAEMRNKAKLIDGFIQQNVDEDRDNFEQAKADGTMDLESRLNNYVKEERNKAIEQLAKTEGVPVEVLDRFFSEYDYLQKQKPEIIQEAVREQHLGLSKTRKAVKRILASLNNIINIFNWD
jgi:type I restriction enzyme R subunit